MLSFHASFLCLYCCFCLGNYTGWAKKTAHGFKAVTYSAFNHFSQFLAHVYYKKLTTGWCMVRPPNAVYVATLPCKILNHNFTDVYTFTTINTLPLGKIFTFRSDSCYSKWNNANYSTTGMCSTVIKDLLLHNRPQLSRIAWIKASSAAIAIASDHN